MAIDEYYTLRFLPDLATGEFQNVGIVVLSQTTRSVLVRIPEEPSDFLKIISSRRQMFADCLGQFLAVIRTPKGLHDIEPGLLQREYEEGDRARLQDYIRGVAAPLALSGPHKCNAVAPVELTQMLYNTLIKPPPAEREPRRSNRVDYHVRDRLCKAGLYGRDRIFFNAKVQTPLGEYSAKMGYRSTRGQIVLNPVNFASGQASASAEVTRAYTSADLVTKFMETNGLVAYTVAAFQLNGQPDTPPTFDLLIAGHQKLIDLGARDSYEIEDPRTDGASLTVLPGDELEPVVQDLFKRVYVRETLNL